MTTVSTQHRGESKAQFCSCRQTTPAGHGGGWGGSAWEIGEEPQDQGRKGRLGGTHSGAHSQRKEAGTRGSQAAVGISVLAVLLLLKLSHQAEFSATAAFGEIHHILCGKQETLRIRYQGTTPQVTPGSERQRGQKMLCSKFTYSCVFPLFLV